MSENRNSPCYSSLISLGPPSISHCRHGGVGSDSVFMGLILRTHTFPTPLFRHFDSKSPRAPPVRWLWLSSSVASGPPPRKLVSSVLNLPAHSGETLNCRGTAGKVSPWTRRRRVGPVAPPPPSSLEHQSHALLARLERAHETAHGSPGCVQGQPSGCSSCPQPGSARAI